MKQQKTRELLVTTKVAKNWNSNFEQQIDALINLVSKVDTDANMQQATEILDVYHNAEKPRSNKRKASHNDRPFEFFVFRN